MILCSTMSQLPFFTWHNILCGVFGQPFRWGVRCAERRVFLRVCVVAKHNNMHYARQHCVRSARLPRFSEMFQWRKSLVCCFSALICICGVRRCQFNARRRQFNARRRQFYARRRLFHSRRTCRRLLCLCHNRWQQ